MTKVVGNSRYQMVANTLLILNRLKKGPITRAALARELGLQPSTVTYSINRLMECTLVREAGTSKKTSGPGRKGIALKLNSDFGCVIGLEMLSDTGWVSVLNLAGEVVLSRKIEYAPHPGEQQFKALIKEVIAEITPSCKAPVIGVGIALPGIVESEKNLVAECWTHALYSADFTDLFEEFPFPVILGNDANCCAQNHLFSTPRQNDFIYLLARYYTPDQLPENVSSIGIGLGLVFDGKLHLGAHSKAGEMVSALMPNPTRGEQLARAMKRRDLLKNPKQLNALIEELAANMRMLDSVLDPASLYLGGFITRHGEYLLPLLSDTMKEKIIFTDSHTDASKGAGAAVLSRLFAIPRVGEISDDIHLFSLIENNFH